MKTSKIIKTSIRPLPNNAYSDPRTDKLRRKKRNLSQTSRLHKYEDKDTYPLEDKGSSISNFTSSTPKQGSTIETHFQDIPQKKKWIPLISNRCLRPCVLLSMLICCLIGINSILIAITMLKKSTTTSITATTTTTTTMSCSASGSTTQAPGGRGGASVLYTFDNTPNDYFGNYNAVPVNSPVYASPGYNGRGQMILLRKSLSQYLTVANHMSFYQQSLTVEAWIYPLTACLTDTYIDYMIFAQTDSSVIGQLMWFMLRNPNVYGAFYGNDVIGLTIIATNQWHHIAFTYDYPTQTQTVYVNGVKDGIHTNATPCKILTRPQSIGAYKYPNGVVGSYFDGYLDQLVISLNKSKSQDQILDDATLVAHYSMDCLSYSSLDSGPNQIDGTVVGLSSDGGRIGQSYLFNSATSYFQVTGLILLGQTYRPFSFALWLRPIISVTNGGTILHASQTTTGVGWCYQYLGLSSTGEIIVYIPGAEGAIQLTGPVLIINEWVHIAVTHSRRNGLCLYVNGLLYGQSDPFIYQPSGVSMIVTLGQPLSGSTCSRGSIQSGYYQGQIDEFYIYSRELSKKDVMVLVNQ